MRLRELKDLYIDQQEKNKLRERWRAFREKFDAWAQVQTRDPSFQPCISDVAIQEPFKSIIFASNMEHAEFQVDEIDRVAREWTESRDQFLFSLLPQDLQDRYLADKPSLRPLAILRFSSRLTGTLDDICKRRRYPPGSNPPQPEDVDIVDMLSTCSRISDCPRPWNWDNQDLVFDDRACDITKDILRLLELDPYTTTTSQLEQCNRKFKCLRCANSSFYWRCDERGASGPGMVCPPSLFLEDT